MLTTIDYYMYLFPAKINTRLRILLGYTMFSLSSLAVVILDVATLGKGGIGTFIGTCIISASFGVGNGHVQGGMTGDLSLMCPEFIQSFYAGLAASGALTSILRFITKAAFENSQDGLRKGATLFSTISCFFGLLCLSIVTFYRSKAACEGSLTVTADLAAGGIQTNHDPVSPENPARIERWSTMKLLFENKDYVLDLFLIYLLTFAIIPGFLAEDTGSHSMGSWYPIVLIACTYTWDLLATYIPLIEQIKMTSRKWLLIAVLARFLLIPAFYYTVKYGGQGLMILLTSFLGLSHGYLSVCVVTEAPKVYKGPEQNALGNLLVFSLLGGIFCGAILDWLWLIGKGW
ncbi:hypothetical protein HU200_007868 [Digitaria exilis]|uniref:Equilibrative nucleoside transporter n=1 Tax=Digitaria exilis TaxID=1010633 RepID=A0A835FPT9_9POAL|nr:hypothetical protein HU200_007868 [Digitaria exilis]